MVLEGAGARLICGMHAHNLVSVDSSGFVIVFSLTQCVRVCVCVCACLRVCVSARLCTFGRF